MAFSRSRIAGSARWRRSCSRSICSLVDSSRLGAVGTGEMDVDGCRGGQGVAATDALSAHARGRRGGHGVLFRSCAGFSASRARTDPTYLHSIARVFACVMESAESRYLTSKEQDLDLATPSAGDKGKGERSETINDVLLGWFGADITELIVREGVVNQLSAPPLPLHDKASKLALHKDVWLDHMQQFLKEITRLSLALGEVKGYGEILPMAHVVNGFSHYKVDKTSITVALKPLWRALHMLVYSRRSIRWPISVADLTKSLDKELPDQLNPSSMSEAQFKYSDRMWTTRRAKTEGQSQTAVYTEDEQALFRHVVGVLESLTGVNFDQICRRAIAEEGYAPSSSTVASLVFALLDYHCEKRSFTQFDKTIAAPYLEGFAASGGRGRVKGYTAPISTNDKHKAAAEVAIKAIEESEGVARDVAESYWWDGSAESYYPYLTAYEALLKADLVTVGIDKFFRSLDKFWEDVPTEAAATRTHGPRWTIEEAADYLQIVLNIVAKKNAAYTKALADVGGDVEACELRKPTEKRIRIGLIVHSRLENYHNGVNADGNKDTVFPHRSSTALIAQRSLNTGMFAMAAAGMNEGDKALKLFFSRAVYVRAADGLKRIKAAKEQLQTSGKEEEIDYEAIYRKVCSKHDAEEAEKAEKAKSKKGKGKKKDKQGGESE